MFTLDINFLSDRPLSESSLWIEPSIYKIVQEELRAISFSTPTDRQKAAKAVEAVYEFFGHNSPEIRFVCSPYAAINLLMQEYPLHVIPISPHVPFFRRWKKILKKQLDPLLIDRLSITEVDAVLEQLAQQLLMDDLLGELNKAFVKVPDLLGKCLTFPIESAISLAFNIRQGRQQIPNDPTRELHKQFPSEISFAIPMSSLESQLRVALGDDLDAQIWENLLQKIDDSAKVTDHYSLKIVRPEEWLYKYGFWINACIYELETASDCHLWQIFQAFVQDCGWILPFEKVCIVCDRPISVSFDDQGVLHAEDQPAIEFADGYSVYVNHGEISPQQPQIPHEVVLPPPHQIPSEQLQESSLLTQKNMEIRRALIQSLGSGGIYQELHAAVLDVWQEYELLRIKSNLDAEAIHLLKKTCPSTGQIQTLRVPHHIQSAQQAFQWTNWEKDPNDFS